MLPLGFRAALPMLAPDNHRITSPQTGDYNCIAWAAGEDDRWWWPGSPNDSYWPDGAPQLATIDSFVEAFATLGYARCRDGAPQPDVEKVVLYVDASGTPTHMARQLATGEWTSKLGPQFDISHASPEVVSAGEYGSVAVFMARPR